MSPSRFSFYIIATLAFSPTIWASQAQGNFGTDASWPFKSGTYSDELKLAREGRLIVPSGFSTFRLTVIPTNRKPVIVRIEIRGRTAKLHATLIDGIGGFGSRGIDKSIDRELTVDELSKFRAIVSKVEREPSRTGPGGFDGSNWLLEHSGRHYRAYERWSPVDGAVRSAGLYMLELTGWSFRNPEKW